MGSLLSGGCYFQDLIAPMPSGVVVTLGKCTVNHLFLPPHPKTSFTKFLTFANGKNFVSY